MRALVSEARGRDRAALKLAAGGRRLDRHRDDVALCEVAANTAGSFDAHPQRGHGRRHRRRRDVNRPPRADTVEHHLKIAEKKLWEGDRNDRLDRKGPASRLQSSHVYPYRAGQMNGELIPPGRTKAAAGDERRSRARCARLGERDPQGTPGSDVPTTPPGGWEEIMVTPGNRSTGSSGAENGES